MFDRWLQVKLLLSIFEGLDGGGGGGGGGGGSGIHYSLTI